MFDIKAYSKTERYKAVQKAYREKHKVSYKEKRRLAYRNRIDYYKQLYQDKKQYFQQYREQHRAYYREYYQKYRKSNPDYYNIEAKQKRALLRNEILDNIKTIPKKTKKPLDNNFVIPDKISIRI
jgi:hypothetical protein